MVLPLSLLRSSRNLQMLIELKNGDSYNGELVGCDSWMNIHLKNAIFTSKDGDKFVRIPEVFIRGPTIKLMHIPDEVMSAVNDEVVEVRRQQQNQRDYGHNRRGGNNYNGHRRGGGNAGQGRGQYRNYNNRHDNAQYSSDRDRHGGTRERYDNSRGGEKQQYDNRGERFYDRHDNRGGERSDHRGGDRERSEYRNSNHRHDGRGDRRDNNSRSGGGGGYRGRDHRDTEHGSNYQGNARRGGAGGGGGDHRDNYYR